MGWTSYKIQAWARAPSSMLLPPFPDIKSFKGWVLEKLIPEILSYPMTDPCMVYMLTLGIYWWDSCYHIYHTWILWVCCDCISSRTSKVNDQSFFKNRPAFTLIRLRSIHQPIPLCPRQWKGTISEKQSFPWKTWLRDSSKPSPRYKIRSAFSFSWTCHQNNIVFPKPHWFALLLEWCFGSEPLQAPRPGRLGLKGVLPRHLRCTPLMMTREQTWDRKLWCSPAKCRGEKSSGRRHPYNLIRIISKYIIIYILHTHTHTYIYIYTQYIFIFTKMQN